MKRYTPILIAACVALVASITPMHTADGLAQGNLGTIGSKTRHIEKDFLPIAAIYPGSVLPTQPYALFRPTVCGTPLYCDALTFEVDYSEEFRRKIVVISITLTWDNPYHAERNPTGNDLDMFLYTEGADPVSGIPISECKFPPEKACNSIHPEVIALIDPPITTEEEPEVPEFHLTIVNEFGANLGYTIALDFLTAELPPGPKFSPPKIDVSKNPVKAVGPFDFEVTESTDDPGQAVERVISVPGPDGELHEVTLPIYEAGQRLESDAGGGLSPWVSAGIAGGLVLIGLSFGLIRRNRRMLEE